MADSTPTPDPTPTDPPAPPPDPTPDPDEALGDAGRRAIQAERDARRAADKKARDLEAEIEQLRRAQMTENERAVAEAEERGRKTATTEVAQRIAAAEIRAALTGIVPDPGAVVEDLNLSRYVTDTGDVDTAAVVKLREKYEAFATKNPPKPDPGPGDGGHRGGPPATDPGEMSMADYIAGRREGRIV
jgi:hypothetical protein